MNNEALIKELKETIEKLKKEILEKENTITDLMEQLENSNQ
jgi:hypothetical protein